MTISISTKIPLDYTKNIFSELLAAAPKLAQKDFTLWGKEAEAESSIRLNWVDLPTQSLELLPEISRMQKWIAENHLTDFILAGMGGSSLGPEVLAKTFGKKLVVLDSTDPAQILAATPQDLTHVAIIVGSKSGSTAETASQKAYFTRCFEEAGIDPRKHFIIITDPSSPFDIASRADGYFVINADPNVGGRFSVLSAFGIIPAAALGIDVEALLKEASQAAQEFTQPNSPAAQLAALILQTHKQNISFFDSGSSVPGLSDWIEQLIAESTGKAGKGFLPIAIESIDAPVAGDSLRIGFSHDDSMDIVVNAPLGAHFILWEWVTSLLAIPLEINPFDQPNVQDAKTRALALLKDWSNSLPTFTPVWENENLQIFSSLHGDSLETYIENFLALSPGYIAVMAYLARGIDDEITALRGFVAQASGVGTSFGWGPRFLHSTGQFHKGGVPNGAFIQITGESARDLEIPGQAFTFHTLLMAQALGDGEALGEKKFPLLRFHLKNREAGIQEIIGAFKSFS